jgi:phosphoglycerate kinase
VKTVPTVVGPEAEAAVANLRPGEILMLENTRFEPGEEANDPELARGLGRLADLSVNDAFGAAHRAHASTAGVAYELPAYAGFLLQREEEVLTRLLREPERPFIAILGGAKVSDKLAVLDRLVNRVDALLLGGGMANTVLMAQGFDVGTSLREQNRIGDARQVLASATERGVRVLLPVDAVVASSIDDAVSAIAPVDGLKPSEAIFDIGPKTVRRFCDEIATARTIFWNGPMGVFEREPFAGGTLGVARCVASANAFTVVGGGDSVAAIEAAGVANRIDHISTGGGASLEFLEGRELPGITAIPEADG